MEIKLTLPLVEEILDEWKDFIGRDFQAYKNYVYRVVNLCTAICEADQQAMEKISIAGCFHDIGIWSDKTFDYLAPSVEHAKHYLERIRKPEWFEEVRLMITEHHKITPYRGSFEKLVEAYRQADWIDVTRGKRHFGVPRTFIRKVLETFPNSGFHKLLTSLTKQRFLSNPLNPLPMFKW